MSAFPSSVQKHGFRWLGLPSSHGLVFLSVSQSDQAQELLCACELLQSPTGAFLVASRGHLRREQNDLEGDMLGRWVHFCLKGDPQNGGFPFGFALKPHQNGFPFKSTCDPKALAFGTCAFVVRVSILVICWMQLSSKVLSVAESGNTAFPCLLE